MELRYENSFGGFEYTPNPIGPAELEDGNFTESRCDFANFASALLNRATFERVAGRQGNL